MEIPTIGGFALSFYFDFLVIFIFTFLLVKIRVGILRHLFEWIVALSIVSVVLSALLPKVFWLIPIVNTTRILVVGVFFWRISKEPKFLAFMRALKL